MDFLNYSEKLGVGFNDDLKFRVIEQYDPTFNTIDVFTSYYAVEKNERIMKTSSTFLMYSVMIFPLEALIFPNTILSAI